TQQRRAKVHPFVVAVTLDVDTHPAEESVRRTERTDYGVIASTVVGIVEGEPVDLIETLAQRIADACLADPRVDKVQVTVHKPDGPISVPFDDIAVTIERGRA